MKDIHNTEIDRRGVSPDIPCHTSLCIRCNIFEECRFSSQTARDIKNGLNSEVSNEVN